MSEATIIGAFSEDDASRLSGVSRAQLRHWHRVGLLEASLGPQGESGSYQRIYSFRDLVALRILGVLRNDHGISLQHLREVARKLGDLGPERWTSATLYVLGRRVVFDDPRTGERKEVVSGQRVFDIPIVAAVSDTEEAIRRYNVRDAQDYGVVVRDRFRQGNEPVFAKSRIPVSAVRQYLDRGYSAEQIVEEFPSLSREDVDAVAHRSDNSAA